MSSTTTYCAYWSENALRAFLEFLFVFRAPPVFQIAPGIVLCSLIVKAVRQLVADGAAGVAVVGCVVHFGVIERRLENTRGEVRVVHLWIAVGVHRERAHAALSMVHRLADLVEVAVAL